MIAKPKEPSSSGGEGFMARVHRHGNRTAIRADRTDYSYARLLEYSAVIAAALLACSLDLEEARVAFVAPIGFEYFAMLLAIWRAGGVAVPLSASATVPEIKHVLGDSDAQTVLATHAHADKLFGECAPGGRRLLLLEQIESRTACALPEVDEARRAMILYTSGTTSRPKGVVSTHANIRAQIETLVDAWEWSEHDRIPLFLPLHHIHGIINVASCALWSGAQIEAFPKFEAPAILERVAAGAYTIFMAVPTIYVKLIESLESGGLAGDFRQRALQGFSGMRLMVSGSAALPPSIHEKWSALTGQSLLERYGMTETGMITSNPFHGERRRGTVGRPFPSVQLRLKSEEGEVITAEGEPGEIQVRGPMVFNEYWNQPTLTAGSFDGDWFCTGDLAVLEGGYYRLLGRLSVDIIKSGGYKVSALEIEAALLEHPAIRECAVVGIADDTWGEIVAVAAALEKGPGELDLEELHRWSKDRLSPYKLPRRLLVVDSLPRNAMGKVTKHAVSELFESAFSR